MKYFLFLFFSFELWAAPVSRLDVCNLALSTYPRFKFGQVTHRNQTAEEVFSSPATTEGKPRLVMMIGVPGSGKTTWTKKADPNEWIFLHIDEIRSEIIRQQGLDPLSGETHFSPEILKLTHDELDKKTKSAFRSKKSIILDQSSLTPLRAKWTSIGRENGYYVEAVVFSPEDEKTNFANVQLRTNGIRVSQENILNRYRQFLFFNSEIRLNEDVSGPGEITTDIFPYLKLVEKYQSLDHALKEMDSTAKEKLEAQLRPDFFDKVHFIWTPNLEKIPLDSPVMRSHMRIYAALTNKCNRACPWCSVYSTPLKNTFLEPEQLQAHFPKNEIFDLQLEGGEPTIHPKLFEFVESFRKQPNAGRLILITNGVKLPKKKDKLKEYLLRFGTPFTIKMSINHYLLDHDKNLIEKSQLLQKVVASLGSDYELIFNVRLRRGKKFNDDAAVLDLVREAGLDGQSNIFFLQRYGLASGEMEWEKPFTINDGFKLINPDGKAFSGTLEDRADEMGNLK